MKWSSAPILFAVLFSLCTCVSAQETTSMATSQTFPAQQEWLTKWDNSLAYSLEALMAADDADLDFRPTPDQMTLREQFHHMATNVYSLTSRFIDAPDGFDLAATRKAMDTEADRTAIAATLTAAYFFAAKTCRLMEADEWDAEAKGFWIPGSSKRTILYLLQDHATHHRAQTLVYLRLLGHTPPNYRGW